MEIDYLKSLKDLQSLSDLEHFQNIINILRYDDFWNNEEMAFYMRMYDGLIMQHMEWDNMTICYRASYEKLLKAIGWR
jgi:hypothetical protein